MTGSAIDLGVLPPADRGGGPPPARGRPRRPAGWVAGVLGVLLLLTATASAAPHPPWAVPHFTVSAGADVERGGLTLTEDTLYVHGWTPDQQQTLSAYRLSDGALLWEKTADYVEAWSGKPVLQEATGQIILLEPETGRPRGHGPGNLAAVVGDRLLFAEAVRTTPIVDGENVLWPVALTALDRHTTREVWSLPPVQAWSYSPDRSWLVTVDGQQLSSRDLATGALLATAQVPELETGGDPKIVGDVVVVWQQEPQPWLRAYQLGTLRHLWSVELPHEFWGLDPCGQLLCVYGGPDLLAALDPASGEWRWSGLRPYHDHFDAGWLPGHILAGDPDEVYRVVDATTGEVVFQLGEWRPQYGDGPVGLVTRYDPNRQAVVEQLGPNRREVRFHEAGRTWFAQLHPDPPRLEVLGFVDGGVDGCEVTAGYIACEGGDTVRVWRVR